MPTTPRRRLSCWELTAKAHVQGVGWKTFRGIKAGTEIVVGTKGQRRRLEMVEISVARRPEGDRRKLRYRVWQEGRGWKSWTPEGYPTGSEGMGARLEAFQAAVS